MTRRARWQGHLFLLVLSLRCCDLVAAIPEQTCVAADCEVDRSVSLLQTDIRVGKSREPTRVAAAVGPAGDAELPDDDAQESQDLKGIQHLGIYQSLIAARRTAGLADKESADGAVSAGADGITDRTSNSTPSPRMQVPSVNSSAPLSQRLGNGMEHPLLLQIGTAARQALSMQSGVLRRLLLIRSGSMEATSLAVMATLFLVIIVLMFCIAVNSSSQVPAAQQHQQHMNFPIKSSLASGYHDSKVPVPMRSPAPSMTYARKSELSAVESIKESWPAPALSVTPQAVPVTQQQHPCAPPQVSWTADPHTTPQALPATAGAADQRNTMDRMLGDHDLLPHLYPSLVLPRSQAKFRVSVHRMRELLQTPGDLNIAGTSGRILLHAVLTNEYGNGVLKISSVDCADRPRTVVRVAPRRSTVGGSMYGSGNDCLEVYGRQDTPYGILQGVHGTDTIQLLRGGVPALTIDTDNVDRLSVTATNLIGQRLAWASRDSPQSDDWKLEVEKNVDAILLCTCLLSRALMLPWVCLPIERPSMPLRTSGESATPSLSASANVMAAPGRQASGGPHAATLQRPPQYYARMQPTEPVAGADPMRRSQGASSADGFGVYRPGATGYHARP